MTRFESKTPRHINLQKGLEIPSGAAVVNKIKPINQI
jgi:hypothetical protein